ncbi:aarF domain-containing protein kinase 1-like [Ptychodera flava]|uniref:aarF domain-containing protein kinase 1-like n=1 Tax=Ptychodera flava TaxID=63121 RepID=UPI003969FFBC
MSRRLLKYVIAGGTMASGFEYLRRHDFDVSSIGVVRFGRAFAAAVYIFADYKITLKGVDRKSEVYRQLMSKIHLRSAIRLREMCCANGGVFIKVGQHVGALEYLLPAEYVQTMKVLHNDAPQSPLKDMHRVIEEDLGKEVQELFTSFSEKPIGAASLAQVYKATLHDGTVVAVKVQHLNVKKHSFVDLKTMELLIHAAAWLFPEFQFLWLAEETKKNLPLELDFVHEGHNCEKVAKLYKHFKFLKVPKVYWKLTTGRILTMEFCEGGKVDDKEYMKKHNINVDKISKNLGKLYSEMIFVKGYVHCDPHPGNIFINKTDENDVEIVLLDHGLYQTLTDDFRLNYSLMWQSLINADIEGIKKHSQALGAGELYGLFACMLTARSWTAVTTGIDKVQHSDAEADEIKQSAATYLPEISDLLNRVPRQMLLVLKTNDLLRGIEWTLQTHADASSFINMSRCCVRAVTDHELRQCHSWLPRTRVHLKGMVMQRKIDIYEIYMWFWTSFIGRWVRKVFSGSIAVRALPS